MDFGNAIKELKYSNKVQRTGWNDKGMYVHLNKGGPTQAGNTVDPYFVMFTAGGTFQPGWLASQADMLATDWCVV